jgi:hypothetical protein
MKKTDDDQFLILNSKFLILTWPRLYAAVLLFLALQILLFTLFTKAFQ